ncbi:GGDEF domain-containing protein [Desulfogranum marinum]|uniref:GGDEF domain-containing protein n=1 Tax=Desulfogranum marinum TaxID=453220 RepID=UPI00196576A7|nr:GGDEF domain-containing protein [Desulfogranum marinum]MBM9511916.1 GGDEF domain-containing protein [Desulfogranum marinum]
MEPYNNSSLCRETEADRRRNILDDSALSIGLVSAFAGGRLLTKEEVHRLDDLKKERGHDFFSDLLYSVSHQYFSAEIAEKLWDEIIQHKNQVSTLLQRDIGIVVAALDYLSNVTYRMNSPTLVCETVIEEIVGLSLRDGLTGLFNHTYFFQQIDLEVRRSLRYDTILSLLLIDIDNFKTVNDTYGHQEGDRVLAAMAKVLLVEARDSDICCRYGGEEFAVILPFTDIHATAIIAERIRTKMAVQLPDGKELTVSIGVASCGKAIRTYRDLVDKADAALYRAKKSGKNQVVLANNERKIVK